MPAARTPTAAPRYGAPPASARSGARARRPPSSRSTHRTPLRIRWERVGRVALLIVLAVVLGLYLQQGIAYLSARSQADQQATIANRLARDNARLRQQESALNSPTTIIEEARQLGMIKPGERPYVLTGLPSG